MLAFQLFLKSPRARKALRTKPGQQGFSLIELVVVIAILGILIAIALPNFLGVQKDAKINQAKNALATIVKECAVKETRFDSATVGETATPGTGGDTPVASALGSVSGYTLKGDITTAGTAYTVFPVAATAFDGTAANKDLSCYGVVAEADGGTLPSFSIEFDNGQTTKICEVTAATTYVSGCFDSTQAGEVNLPKGAAAFGKW